MTGGQAQLRADVVFDTAGALEAIAACRTAAQVCDGVAASRARAGAHARVGWEGRMRDSFDLADGVLLDELSGGVADLEAVATELESLAECAASLQASVDRHNEQVRRARDEAAS